MTNTETISPERLEYLEFIESKRHSATNYGINPTFLPDAMFDFQKYVCEYLIKKGRAACFLDTGLGKTIIELTVAINYARHTNKPVLIICPLAVAFQFIKESEKFGIDDVAYSRSGTYNTKIVLCNYEQIDKFNPTDFDCVILDESSIIKDSKGVTRKLVTSFLKKVKYRLMFTATPSPNDYIELGTSSEALGYLGYADMLTKFFKNNNNTIKSSGLHRVGEKWYLKSHAERDFWRWVSSWSVSCKKPSDLGFIDDRYILPELIERETVVKNNTALVINGQIQAFNMPAMSFAEIQAEVRTTIKERCEMAFEKASEHDISVYWVNLNPESDMMREIDKSAYEVRGKMSIEQKEEILISFSSGDIKKLITKSKITAFGLNWQHCNHSTYFPTYSYEKYYQAIRRFWRFGQKKEVVIDKILSDGQSRITAALSAKKEKAEKMFEQLIVNTNSDYSIVEKGFDKKITLPTFLK